jgi:cell division septum initiation protein DivIVA
MIGTDISGGSGGNQLLDLLSLVANPDAYAEKVKSLETLIAENKKFVELVAPADDIISLRSKLQAELQEAADAKEAAKTESSQILSESKSKAAALTRDAEQKAKKIIEDAEAIKAEAQAELASVKASTKAANDAENASRAAEAESNAKAEKADATLKAAEADRQELADMRLAIIAKHKAFIESL